jgi:hypothetical protein
MGQAFEGRDSRFKRWWDIRRIYFVNFLAGRWHSWGDDRLERWLLAEFDSIRFVRFKKERRELKWRVEI